jgi:hypothetical protein
MTECHDRVGSNVSSHSEVRDSNRGPETGYPDRGLRVIPQSLQTVAGIVPSNQRCVVRTTEKNVVKRTTNYRKLRSSSLCIFPLCRYFLSRSFKCLKHSQYFTLLRY